VVINATRSLNLASFGFSTAVTITNNGALTLQGGETNISGVTNGASSNVTYNGTGTYTSLLAGSSYNNLTFNAAGTWRAAADVAVTGTLNVTAGTFDISTNAKLLTVTGALTVDGGTLTATNGNITANGGVTISTSGTLTAPGAGKSFNVKGNWTNSATFTHSSGTVSFVDTTGTQQINSGGTAAAKQFYNITINNSGTSVQLVTNDLTQAAGGVLSFTAGTLDLNSRILTLGANFATSWPASSNLKIIFSDIWHCKAFCNLSPMKPRPKIRILSFFIF